MQNQFLFKRSLIPIVPVEITENPSWQRAGDIVTELSQWKDKAVGAQSNILNVGLKG